MSKVKFYATGRRKVASAKVWLTPGSGVITINGRSADAYFAREVLQMLIRQPLEETGMKDKYDVVASVEGGGLSGQAGAVRHGISRALLNVDDGILRPTLKRGGYLTRDARMVERKKYGQSGARKRYQYSKR